MNVMCYDNVMYKMNYESLVCCTFGCDWNL